MADIMTNVGDVVRIPHPEGDVTIEVKQGGTWDVCLGIQSPSSVMVEIEESRFMPTGDDSGQEGNGDAPHFSARGK